VSLNFVKSPLVYLLSQPAVLLYVEGLSKLISLIATVSKNPVIVHLHGDYPFV